MHTTTLAQATNEFQKSQKCDIFKMRKKSTSVKISRQCFVCFLSLLDQFINNCT